MKNMPKSVVQQLEASMAAGSAQLVEITDALAETWQGKPAEVIKFAQSALDFLNRTIQIVSATKTWPAGATTKTFLEKTTAT